MTGRTEQSGVVLDAGQTGASFLRGLFERARAAFPEEFANYPLPSEDTSFKARLAELVPQFEALRAVSERRSEIARSLCLDAVAQLCFVDERGARPLSAALHEASAALPLLRVDLPGLGQLQPAVEFGGRLHEGPEVATLASDLCAAHLATRAAADALIAVAQRAQARGLSLKGERFVLLGAGAELSPTYALLEAGAEVLWLDLHNPPIDHLLEPRLGGVLHYVDGGVDLLARPAAVRATIAEFAKSGPVHIGLYAFAPGGARELRLAISSIALLGALPPESIRSVLLLLSPTSASPLSREDAERADERRRNATAVQRALLRTGPLSPGHVVAGEGRISCAVVTQQGASYQAAEYVGKRLAAEALFEYGSSLDRPRAGTLALSVNMAPITDTRSMASPLLEASILGAPAIEMLIATPTTSRAVSSLLTIHDLLAQNGELAGAALSQRERAQQLFAQQFHGGVYAQPFALEGLIRMAALRGITQRPKLAFELLR